MLYKVVLCDAFDISPEDVRVVALEQLVLRDKTLNEVFNLDYSEEAERDSIGGQWRRRKVENEGEVD